MIKHVDQYPVSIIFPDGGEKIYKIPKYQREYTWGQKNWDALFNDIIENDKGYFLGSYICVSDSAMTNSSELIDGQQRFTSLSLLLFRHRYLNQGRPCKRLQSACRRIP
jgi:uncharacterized protein with ParB-like and HNH nuclease domain